MCCCFQSVESHVVFLLEVRSGSVGWGYHPGLCWISRGGRVGIEGVMAEPKRAGACSPGTWAENIWIFTQIKCTVLSRLLI